MTVKKADEYCRNLENCLSPKLLLPKILYALPDDQGKMLCQLSQGYIKFIWTCAQSKQKTMLKKPICEFKGILAKTVITANGVKAIALILWHKDKNYCVPLLVSRSLVKIATSWKYWAQSYNLPMFWRDLQDQYIAVAPEDSLVELLLQYKEKPILPVQIRSEKTPLGLKVSLKDKIFAA